MKNKVELKNGTVLEVGKSYLNEGWVEGEQVTITAIGDSRFLAHDEMGYEDDYYIDDNWFPYEEPKTDKWYEYLHLNYESEEESRYVLWYSDRPRLANVIHLREWDSKQQMIEDLKK